MTTSSRTEPTRPPRPEKPSPAGFIGFGGLACVMFLILATALVAPWWVTALFLVLWLVLFVISVRWFLPYPRRLPWLAVVGFLAWFPTIALGTRLLGWGS